MAASRRVTSPMMVGRVEELSLVRQAVDEMAAGPPKIVVLGGESGVGKTRLLDEALAQPGKHVRVLRGNSLALEAELPYLPFAKMIRELLRGLDPDEAKQIIGPAGPELAQFMPELAAFVDARGPGSTGVGSELQRLRLFEALLRVAEGIATHRPTVFVFEDLQWIDHASLQLLSFLIHNIREGDALLVLTIRTEALEAGGSVLSFLAELERDQDVIRIELERLDAETTRRQINAILDEGVATATVERIWRLGDGNPLFTEELVAAADLGRDDVTPRLRDLLGARIARLSSDAQAVLGVAATVGRAIDVELLTAASGLDEPQVRSAIRAGVDEQVLVHSYEEGGYQFRHELIRSAISADLGTSEARRIHAAYARALLSYRTAPDAAEIAHHWDGAAEPAEALPWHVRAGYDAETRFAYEAAAHHYVRVLDLWPEVAEPEERAAVPRRRVMQRASISSARAGDHGRAIELARSFLAEDEDEDDLADQMRSSLRWYLWEAGHVDEALAEAREAVRRLSDETDASWRANALAHLAGLLLVQDELPEARGRAEEALAIATEAGALEEQILANGIIGGCQLLTGETDEGIGRIAEALEAASSIERADASLPSDRLDDRRYPVGVVLAYTQLAAAYEIADRSEDVVQEAAKGFIAARRQGVSRTYGATLRAAGARGLYRLGRWDEALLLIDSALAEGASGSGRIGLLATGALIHVARGHETEAAEALRAADDQAGADVATEVIRWLAAARAESMIWASRPLEAVGVIASAYDEGSASPRGAGLGQAVGLDASLPHLLSQAARASADLALHEKAGGIEAAAAQMSIERVRSAIRRAQRRSGLASSWATDLAVTNAELARAEHGPGPRSVKRWRAAAAAADGKPYVEAYARYRLASALLGDRRKAAEASQELAQATSLATAIGATRLQEAIAELAGRAGLTRDGSQPSPERPFGLTEREVEVLGLLAAGLSNAEIADELFISPKTASVHVSNIYSKLGVESRVAAATVAHELGLAASRPEDEAPAQK